MNFFQQNEVLDPIYQRAISLLISRDFAYKQKGEIFVTNYQDSEQANQRRELLEVEQIAIQHKVIEEHGQNQFQKEVATKLLSKVKKQVVQQLESKEVVFNQILKIESAASDILEILSLRAASIKRITPLAASLPWLSNDLINLVNKPQYRKRSLVKISDPGVAVSYVGLNNLCMVMPTFILKHWLPENIKPFTTIKRKLWQNCLATAMASRTLAKSYNIDEYTAFTASILSCIGNFTVVRCLNDTFHHLHQAASKKAFSNKDKRLHDALKTVEPTPELLLELICIYNSKVAGEVVEMMHFDRLNITEAIFELSFAQDQTKMSILAKIILKSHAYIHHRSLMDEELLDKEEAKQWLTLNQLSAKDVHLLNKTDIDHIKLQFN